MNEITCTWDDCDQPGTHTVTVGRYDAIDATRTLCREHDRRFKIETVRARPMKPPEVVVEPPNVVRCGACRLVLDVPSDQPPGDRTPCPGPDCGSQSRFIEKRLSETLTFRSSVGLIKKDRSGEQLLRGSTGDDFTWDLQAWGHRELTIDQENHRYRELIEVWDGTTIVSTALLEDHRDTRR